MHRLSRLSIVATSLAFGWSAHGGAAATSTTIVVYVEDAPNCALVAAAISNGLDDASDPAEFVIIETADRGHFESLWDLGVGDTVVALSTDRGLVESWARKRTAVPYLGMAMTESDPEGAAIIAVSGPPAPPAGPALGPSMPSAGGGAMPKMPPITSMIPGLDAFKCADRYLFPCLDGDVVQVTFTASFGIDTSVAVSVGGNFKLSCIKENGPKYLKCLVGLP